MKQPTSPMAKVFAAVMLAFSVFLAASVILRADLDFQLQDTAVSLDTSRGRERKQQYEYDEVCEELPRTRAELEAVQPEAQEAAETVQQLKDERKALRAEKKELEAALEQKRAGETQESGADGE